MSVYKNLICILFYALANISLASAMDIATCEPIPTSKKYLSYDFSAPYPKKVVFSCKYACRDYNEIFEIVGISSINLLSSSDEGTNLVCQGVRVRPGRWGGYELDKIVPFYAFDTDIMEVKNWAKKYLDFDTEMEKLYLQNLKETLSEISIGYAQAGIGDSVYNRAFRDSADLLEEIANRLPETDLLERHLEIIRGSNPNLFEEVNGLNYTLRILSIQAKWRL